MNIDIQYRRNYCSFSTMRITSKIIYIANAGDYNNKVKNNHRMDIKCSTNNEYKRKRCFLRQKERNLVQVWFQLHKCMFGTVFLISFRTLVLFVPFKNDPKSQSATGSALHQKNPMYT
jgi:hypothetical protein